MGTYNHLQASLTCPRCGVQVDTEISCYFGDTRYLAYLRIGDHYPWVPRRQPQNGGRPDGGSVDGEGYMECPSCRKDSFLVVVVRGDVIVGVEPDLTQQGYVPD